ncbi:MAG TPA: XRE family transcriptional regulator [Gemmatimonadaceae bacterium]|jgi:predicted XRE-type DNA-binding protein|nr:XRE family transcriptional regulator [Gemmatimonadaceae bacterium]
MAPDDPVLILRRTLAAAISKALGPKSQHVVASYFGIAQPRMSELEHGIVARCTIDWLVRRVYRMGGSVTIQVVLGDAGRAWRQQRLARNRLRRTATPVDDRPEVAAD